MAFNDFVCTTLFCHVLPVIFFPCFLLSLLFLPFPRICPSSRVFPSKDLPAALMLMGRGALDCTISPTVFGLASRVVSVPPSTPSRASSDSECHSSKCGSAILSPVHPWPVPLPNADFRSPKPRPRADAMPPGPLVISASSFVGLRNDMAPRFGEIALVPGRLLPVESPASWLPDERSNLSTIRSSVRCICSIRDSNILSRSLSSPTHPPVPFSAAAPAPAIRAPAP